MRTIPIAEPLIVVDGALDWDVTDTGRAPRRLAAWTRAQVPDVFMAAMIGMGSGVRIRFRSDTTTIELDAAVTGIQLLPDPPMPRPFDLAVDGILVGTATAASGTTIVIDRADPDNVQFVPGDAATIRFHGLAPTMKTLELWLPHAASSELRSLRVDDAAVVEASPPRARRWVHYGSSISHCMEAESPTGIWPVVAAHAAGVEVTNLGLAGQCQLDQFVARSIRDLDADYISLKVGINLVNADSMRERTFGPAVHGFLDTVRDGHPATPLLVVSPIYCPVAEDHPGPTAPGADGRTRVFERPPALREGMLTLTRIRTMLESIVAQRRADGDAALHYMDGLDLFGADDVADLPDLLHPNAAGYRRMGERFAATVFASGGPFATA